MVYGSEFHLGMCVIFGKLCVASTFEYPFSHFLHFRLSVYGRSLRRVKCNFLDGFSVIDF